ncbi:hypothetical protein VTJ04DRAFT_9376 [Mycothermus thermophilus]|uniref:uncharacterized protein n=1 Tax=Humicola insolens TaxID=85995 RepID=UPI0037426767
MKEEIQEKHGLEVALPSPLRCYLELVIRSDPVYDSGTIAQFLIDGLDSDILLASVSDAPVMTATLWKAKRQIPSLELALAELFSFCKSYNQFERLLQAPTLSHLSLDDSNLPPLMKALANLRRWYNEYDRRSRSGEDARALLEGRVRIADFFQSADKVSMVGVCLLIQPGSVLSQACSEVEAGGDKPIDGVYEGIGNRGARAEFAGDELGQGKEVSECDNVLWGFHCILLLGGGLLCSRYAVQPAVLR